MPYKHLEPLPKKTGQLGEETMSNTKLKVQFKDTKVSPQDSAEIASPVDKEQQHTIIKDPKKPHYSDATVDAIRAKDEATIARRKQPQSLNKERIPNSEFRILETSLKDYFFGINFQIKDTEFESNEYEIALPDIEIPGKNRFDTDDLIIIKNGNNVKVYDRICDHNSGKLLNFGKMR